MRTNTPFFPTSLHVISMFYVLFMGRIGCSCCPLDCSVFEYICSDRYVTTGKIAAQCSHATLACYKYFFSKSPDSPILRRWEQGGQAKVALQVKNEEDMLLLQAQALSLGLCARVIQDAGRTQIASGSRTVLGILGPKGVVDKVTGQLKLL